MHLISEKDWHSLRDTNQTLIEKWEALQHAHQIGNANTILNAEMQYFSALQNLNTLVEIALSAASQKRR